MRTILAIGNDESLVSTRAEVLRKCAGDARVVVAKAAEAIGLLKTQLFDLVVLCHTLGMEDLVPIVTYAHNQGAEVKLLKSVPRLQCHYDLVGSDEITLNESEMLMAKVDKMLSGQTRRRTIQ